MADLKPIYRGDTYAYELRFKEKVNQTPIDITGWELAFTMKLSAESADAELQVVKIVDGTEGPSGVAALLLTAEETAQLIPTRYSFDFQVKNGPVTRTLTKGIIKVESDVNHG